MLTKLPRTSQAATFVSSFRSLTLFESGNYYSTDTTTPHGLSASGGGLQASDLIPCRYTMLACRFQRQLPPTPVIRELKSNNGRRWLTGTSPTFRSYTSACIQALTLTRLHILLKAERESTLSPCRVLSEKLSWWKYLSTSR